MPQHCFFQTFLIFFTIKSLVEADIQTCNDGPLSVVCKNVSEIDNYLDTEAIRPWPISVRITTNVLGIVNIDKEKQTAALKLKTIYEWKDDRLAVIRSEDHLKK